MTAATRLSEALAEWGMWQRLDRMQIELQQRPEQQMMVSFRSGTSGPDDRHLEIPREKLVEFIHDRMRDQKYRLMRLGVEGHFEPTICPPPAAPGDEADAAPCRLPDTCDEEKPL
ncbi:hypothetical protein [Falsiroseomonas tokyonensis]|uniref:Uncharacterized protein n=1 Tax=Falsiroseomonas tokyonensis TaxID=430521 RepID=A0ABV7C014_9PROT|nr:hypothetical protein [Falsiroseomonas tokyonensis]MBU8540227.1 hypothetical protein [Falsiroseomonas tokyonensis]